jgi:aconitase A
LKIEVGLIGSCTNSSYEDIARGFNSQTSDWQKIKIKIGIYDHPGSEVRYTIERDGFIDMRKLVQQYLQMLVGHVSECGIEKVLKRRTKHNRSLVQP